MAALTLMAESITEQRDCMTGRFCKPYTVWKIGPTLIKKTNYPSIVNLEAEKLIDTQSGKIYFHRKPNLASRVYATCTVK